MLNKFVITLSLLLTAQVIYPAATITYSGPIGFQLISDYTSENICLIKNLIVNNHNDVTNELLTRYRIQNLQYISLKGRLNSDFESAISEDKVKQAEKYLKAGADVNRLINHNVTALNYAIRHCSPEMVSLLLDNGGNVNNFNSTSKTTPLILAVSLKKEKIVRALINKKVDLDGINWDGNTALLTAIFNDDEEIASLLLAAGADVNKINLNNISPLLHAIECNYINLAKLLLSYNAEITSGILTIINFIETGSEIHKILESEPARRAAAIFKRNEILAEVTQLPKEIIDTISNYVPESITAQDLSLEHKLKTKIQIMEKLLVDIMGTSSTKDRETVINKLKRKSSEALENSCRAEIVETLQKSTTQKETDIISKLLLANDSVATSSSKQDLKEKDTDDDDKDEQVKETASKKARTS